MKQGLIAAALALGMAAGLCCAQDGAKDPAKFYKLDFVVRDLEGGKVLSARNYSMIASTDGPPSQIRAGSHVTVLIGKPNEGQQSQTYDVGTSIDCAKLNELQNDLSFQITVEVSNLLQDQPETKPIVRQNKWSSSVVVPLKKATVVFSSDDNTTKRVLQLEVTATPR